LPHFADGGGWTTPVILTNPFNEPLAGTVQVVGRSSLNQSAPVLNTSVNGMNESVVNYVIPPRSAIRLVTANTSDVVQTGWIGITASGSNAPVAVGIFSFRSRGITVSQASVLAEPAGSAFRMYVERSGDVAQPGSVRSAVAMANPTLFNVAVNLMLTEMDGSLVGQPLTLTIPARGQIAAFLDELFPSSLKNFRGFLEVTADSAIDLVSLRTRYNERGDFLITTTPPRNEGESLTDSEILLPHVVSGGGYSTQVVVFGQPGSGGIWFNSADGALMPSESLVPVQ